MRTIAEIVAYLFFDYEMMLVDVSDESGLVQIGYVDNQVHLSVEVNNALLQLIFANLEEDGDEVALGELEREGSGLVERRNVDLVTAAVSETHLHKLALLL